MSSLLSLFFSFGFAELGEEQPAKEVFDIDRRLIGDHRALRLAWLKIRSRSLRLVQEQESAMKIHLLIYIVPFLSDLCIDSLD